MQPAGGGRVANRFTNRHGKRDDIVLHTRFEFVYACDVHLGARANRCGGLLWHLASLRQSFCGSDFYLKPFREPVGVAPDVAHLWARVAWNQLALQKRINQ